MERRLLQIVVLLIGLMSVMAGFIGAAYGGGLAGQPVSLAADSYIRFLFGIVLAIGFLLLASVYRIEQHGTRFSVLTVLLVIGGLARLMGLLGGSVPTQGVLIGLTLELVVAPLLWLWQRRIVHAHDRQVID